MAFEDGNKPLLDRKDVAVGEEWEARLGGLIAQSDTVVFVVSPEAVEECRHFDIDAKIATHYCGCISLFF